MDPIRRKILKTGAAVTAMAAAPGVFGQQTGKGGTAMSFYEKGPVGSGIAANPGNGNFLTGDQPVVGAADDNRAGIGGAGNGPAAELAGVGCSQQRHRAAFSGGALGCEPPARTQEKAKLTSGT